MPSDLFTPPRQRSQSCNNRVNPSSTPSPLGRVKAELAFDTSPTITAVPSTNNSPCPTSLEWTIKKSKLRSYHHLISSYYGLCSALRWLTILLCVVFSVYIWQNSWQNPLADQLSANWHENAAIRTVLPPTNPQSERNKHNPEKWLNENSNNAFAVNQALTWRSFFYHGRWSSRPNAAIISLVRNEELEGMMQSIRQLEYRWNHKYQYPWIFFSEESFSDEFKAATSNLTSALCYYETIPNNHWSTPTWIDEARYMDSLEYLGTIGVGKGWMLSYRNMCRWNSGFFYLHPALSSYDFYWRVEPDVHFFCDIDYDVFRFLRDNDLKYAFNMAILDDARSFPSLWWQTRAFIDAHPGLIHPDADLNWLLDTSTGSTYNNCQFFSNFEVGSLSFFRSTPNIEYFNWLDEAGGFYYERYGDAPIHTLSASLFLPKSQVWFFRDIGYQHDIARHCPPNSAARCACEPTGLDENFYKLVPMESPQQKPGDTCVRLWLGGKWLEKREGWEQEAERAFGGDGYGGYALDGMTTQ